MSYDAKMAEHLCTRLCHDLTGPIGAINNGTEFLGEQGFDMQNDVLSLISSSAREAVSRLQFYRQAYGKINEYGEADLQEKKQLAEQYFAGSKIKLDWPDQQVNAPGFAISQKRSRLLLNMIVIASKTLIRGGTISVYVESNENPMRTVRVIAKGETIKEDDEVNRVLMGDESIPLSPKSVQAYLTLSLLHEKHMVIHKTTEPNSYTLEARRTATPG